MNATLETERLLEELRTFALRMLSLYGEFVPFGAYVDSHGKLKRLDANGAGSPTAAARMEQVTSALTRIARDRKPRAIGYAANVSFHDEDGAAHDAVHVVLDYRGGAGRDVFLVYAQQEGQVRIVRTISNERSQAALSPPVMH